MQWVPSVLRNFRIRYKLLLGYSGILLIMGLVGGMMMYVLVRQNVESRIQSELKINTTNILSMVRTAAQTSIRNRLRAIAETNYQVAAYYYEQSRLGKMEEDVAKKNVENVLLSQTVGTNGYIYCLNSEGVLVLHPKKTLLGQNISEYAFVQDQMRRREGYLEYKWKNPGETQASPKALFMLYFEPWDWIVSVSSYRKEFTELINVNDFKSSILGLRFGETGYSYIIDSEGHIVLHLYLEGNLYNVQDSKGFYFVKEICRKKTGKIVYTWQNPGEPTFRKKLAVFNYIPEFDWIVVSSSYHDEFFAPLDRLRNVFLLMAFITVLLVIPVSLAISYSITKPIQQLRNRFKHAERGDFSVRMQVSSGDELGQLAGYFNAFMARLETEHKKRHRAERDRRKMSEQLQQSQKMEAIGQLAGGVAHDFNNILTAILGSAELLKLHTSESQHRLIENIIQASSRASDLTRNLLDFSRKGTLQKLPIDIHKMMDEVISLLSHSIDKRIDIKTEFKSQNPTVLGDPSKLQNALLNLGINARDAMQNGGTISFSTADVQITVDTRTRFGALMTGSYLKISVSDTGIGIPESEIARVMEPFYTTKEQGKGTGLGLASVYGSVMIHEGQIELQSTPDKGTTFDIYLPSPDLPADEEDDGAVTDLVYGTGTIMVVDDEDFVRNFGASALKRLGYRVLDFSDPIVAIEYFKYNASSINLVILDLMMPKMNGRETLEALLEIDFEIPVIITSGYGKQQEGDLLKEGAKHFIRKPFRLLEISHVVDRYKRA